MMVLIGFQGVGKTHFGKLCAQNLHWKFIDTDHLMEAQEGMSCRALFLQRGEAVFRAIEKEIIQGIAYEEQAMLATGGGSILECENREKLKSLGTVIYLKNHKIDEIRHPLYEELADVCVEVSNKQEDEILWEVIHLAKSLESPLGASRMARQ